MTATIARTEAEEQLERQFAAVASGLPGGGWVPAARKRAMARFARAGLPHRRNEAWKYTDLRTRLPTAFPPAQCSSRKVGAALLAEALGDSLAALPCIRYVLLNGRLVSSSVPDGAGAGYVLTSLAASLGQPGSDWIEDRLAGETDDGDDAVGALNAAFVTDGIVLDVPAGARVALPIHIVSVIDTSAASAVATRNLIRVGKGARANVLESHVEVGGGASQATAVTRIEVAAEGVARHVKHVAIAAGSTHLGRIDAEIGEGADWRGFQLTAGAGLLRNESRASFTGPDAKLDLSGLMLGRGADHMDSTLIVDHTTTGCESRELFKAVLDGRARAVFQGKVIVAPEAQKTDGKQMAQALMLSEDAEFDSKPELEIYADDVACGHGSTAAELDPDMMFYLRSRGLPETEARALLIESFAGDALDRIEDDAVREAMTAVALAWLRRTA